MKVRKTLQLTLLGSLAACGVTEAAPLVTSKNSVLSVPAAVIASAGVSNLAGSNFIVSAVMPGTAHGGWASLTNTLQWVRRYNAGPGSSQNAGYAIAVRPDGSVVVSGDSLGLGTDHDFVTLCHAADGAPLWTNRYDGPTHGDDYPYKFAQSRSGDVLVSGTTEPDVSNFQLADSVLLRYNATGSPAWTNVYADVNTNSVYPQGLVTDSAGNAYLHLNSVHWDSSGGGDLVEDIIAKYDVLGNPLWTNHYPSGGPGLRLIEGMVVDHAGNLLITGESYDPDLLLPGTSIINYAGDGTAQWTNQVDYQVMTVVRSVSVAGNGDIILTGETGGAGALNGVNYVIMRSSSNGVWLWTNFLAGAQYDGGNVPAWASDPAGNVFLIGGGKGDPLPSTYQIVKYDLHGVPLWTHANVTFGASNSMFLACAADSAGNLYLAGRSAGQNGRPDYVAMKYSGDGQPIWTNRYDGPAGLDDEPIAMALDGAGGLYVTGESQSSIGFWDLATVKFADQLRYTPPKDFTGLDTITFTVVDNMGNSATGSVQVLVGTGTFQFEVGAVGTRMTPGGMQLKLSQAPGTNAVVIEASADLAHWQAISTNVPVGGVVQFLDSGAGGFSRRFYRAHQQQ